MTNAGLAELRQLSLSKLVLDGCTAITATGIAHLTAHAPSLTRLGLAGLDTLDDTALSHVGKLGRLVELNLSKCTGVTSCGLRALRGLAHLRVLGLSRCIGLDDDCAMTLGNLPALETLDVGGCLFSDRALTSLSINTSLRFLRLTACHRIGGEGLAQLSRMPALRTLVLGHLPCVFANDILHLATVAPRLCVQTS